MTFFADFFIFAMKSSLNGHFFALFAFGPTPAE